MVNSTYTSVSIQELNHITVQCLAGGLEMQMFSNHTRASREEERRTGVRSVEGVLLVRVLSKDISSFTGERRHTRAPKAVVDMGSNGCPHNTNVLDIRSGGNKFLKCK